MPGPFGAPHTSEGGLDSGATAGILKGWDVAAALREAARLYLDLDLITAGWTGCFGAAIYRHPAPLAGVIKAPNRFSVDSL